MADNRPGTGIMKIMSRNYAFHRCVTDGRSALFDSRKVCPNGKQRTYPNDFQEITMAWTTPAATDLRFGFEITMYIANR